MPLPTVIIPGYFAADREYFPLAAELAQQGRKTVVVPLKVTSWFPTLGGKPMTPVMQVIRQTITDLCRQTQSEQVNLIGHSAGGWIARLLLGEALYDGQYWGLHPQVATLITLGTPHLSQERFTRTNMNFVNTTYPGAYHQPGVRYICVAGRAVNGRSNWFTRQTYTLTIGQGDCWGDGITPIAAAHLVGAENITLDKVWHSPRGKRFWYGSPEVLGQWVDGLN